MLSGGGIFNNLDYSFFVGHEDGTGVNEAPGGGSKALRSQLKVLSEFLHGFALEHLYPYPSSVLSSPGLIPYVLSDGKGSFAIFLRATGTESSSLLLEAGEGSFLVQELNTKTGTYSEAVSLESVEGVLGLDIEIPEGELALKIIRQ